jgi:hypothetical protein
MYILGIIFSVESLKSVILTLACIERKLTVPQAVLLSRLEEEYQVRDVLLQLIMLYAQIFFRVPRLCDYKNKDSLG